MQTISKVLVCIVFACLLLSWMSGAGRPLHRAHLQNRSSQERHRIRARLRRCRGGNPIHHPVRPCKNAVLPPDDDNDDSERSHAKAVHERLPSLCDEPTRRFNSLTFGSRPLPTEVPRHQTLCILLI
jgi:hypothetical protein